jgi:hypothetical protein
VSNHSADYPNAKYMYTDASIWLQIIMVPNHIINAASLSPVINDIFVAKQLSGFDIILSSGC